MLIGNKKDMEDRREVTFEEAKTFAEENGNFSHSLSLSLTLLSLYSHSR
jgi:hypothetical protein